MPPVHTLIGNELATWTYHVPPGWKPYGVCSVPGECPPGCWPTTRWRPARRPRSRRCATARRASPSRVATACGCKVLDNNFGFNPSTDGGTKIEQFKQAVRRLPAASTATDRSVVLHLPRRPTTTSATTTSSGSPLRTPQTATLEMSVAGREPGRRGAQGAVPPVRRQRQRHHRAVPPAQGPHERQAGLGPGHGLGLSAAPLGCRASPGSALSGRLLAEARSVLRTWTHSSIVGADQHARSMTTPPGSPCEITVDRPGRPSCLGTLGLARLARTTGAAAAWSGSLVSGISPDEDPLALVVLPVAAGRRRDRRLAVRACPGGHPAVQGDVTAPRRPGTVTDRMSLSSTNVLSSWAPRHQAKPPRPPATSSTSASTAAGHRGLRFGATGAGSSSGVGTSEGRLPGWVSSGRPGSHRAGRDPIPALPQGIAEGGRRRTGRRDTAPRGRRRARGVRRPRPSGRTGRSSVDSGGGGGGAAAADSELWAYAGRPLSSRKASAARENWSARASRCSPWACSGATYDGVPAIIVSRDETSSALPSPRSPTIARTRVPSCSGSTVRNSTLAGLMSRWSTPRWWSACSPSPDLPHHLARLGDGQPVALEPVGERALVGVRHHEVGTVVVERPRVVHRRRRAATRPCAGSDPPRGSAGARGCPRSSSPRAP